MGIEDREKKKEEKLIVERYESFRYVHVYCCREREKKKMKSKEKKKESLAIRH